MGNPLAQANGGEAVSKSSNELLAEIVIMNLDFALRMQVKYFGWSRFLCASYWRAKWLVTRMRAALWALGKLRKIQQVMQ